MVCISKLSDELAHRSMQEASDREFIKAYIDRGINIEQFIRLLCHASPLIWTEFMYDEQLSLKKKNQYFKLIINKRKGRQI